VSEWSYPISCQQDRSGRPGFTSILSDVDLVIGILTRDRASDFVLFELGVASALGRQIVLFAPRSYTGILPDLQHFLVIRAGLTNREAISFALDQLLAAPAPHKRETIPKRSYAHRLGRRATDILGEIQDATAAGQERRLEELVARAIRESGVEFVAEAQNIRHTPDLAIWSDALQPLVGNPLLIEIKLRILGSDDARRAVQQLSTAILSSGAGWGLLLYGEGPETRNAWKAVSPNVLVMSLTTLIHQMESRSFVEIIREERNRRVHGEHP
jgi:hypothetical protein